MILRTPREKDDENPGDLQKNWFSDGGICSNFPIHFFDAWLPNRPTFGINLASRSEEAFESEHQSINPDYSSIADIAQMMPDENTMDTADVASVSAPDEMIRAGDVFLPKANEPMFAEWVNIQSLFQFARAILGSAQNYRDNLQSFLPSYRERVVQVRFAPREGGLNLAMDEKTVESIQQKGRDAADLLLNDFNFKHHQWVRFKVLMALMERQLGDLAGTLEDKTYESLIDEQLRVRTNQPFPYLEREDWCEEAKTRIEALLNLVQALNTDEWLVDKPPKPEPVLRVTPEF